MKTRISWTHEETQVLQDWISSNPGIKFGPVKAPQVLLDLLPNKSASVIYAKWYKLRHQHKVTNNCELSNAINALVQGKLEEYVQEIEQLRSENAQLKALLKKLKAVREAVEQFKL